MHNDVELRAVRDGELSIYCKWVVIGKVRHPTHIHRKTNLNEAIYRARLVDGMLKITGHDLITNQELEVTNR